MEVDWNVVFGEMMTQVLRVIIPVCVALVLKWAVELYHRIKTEQPDWVPVLEYAAEVAVLAAEQIFGKGQGGEKKQYAIDTVTEILKEHGVYVNVGVIDDAIEAEVQRWFPHSEKKELATGGVVHYPDIPPINVDIDSDKIAGQIKDAIKTQISIGVTGDPE